MASAVQIDEIELRHPEAGSVPVHVRTGGQGPGLLLLHGWLHSSEIWSELWEPLTQDFRVVAPDLPGFGRSPSLPEEAVGIDGLTEVLGSFLDEERYGPLEAVVADSLGAVLVVRQANRGSDLPSRVVLSGPPADGIQGGWEKLGVPGLIRTVLRVGKSTPFGVSSKVATWTAPTIERRTNELGEKLARLALTADPEAAESVFRDLASTRLEADRAREALETGGVVVGAEDQVIPQTQASHFAERLGFTFTEVEGAGHTPMLERPGEYLRAIRPVIEP